MEDRVEETLRASGENLPTDLSGKILLGPLKAPAGWVTYGNKVTGLNIFSTFLSVKKMVTITSEGKEDCGEDGDYLAWSEANWLLQGEASLGSVEKSQVCAETSAMDLYKGKVTMRGCMRHCGKVKGRVPSVWIAPESW